MPINIGLRLVVRTISFYLLHIIVWHFSDCAEIFFTKLYKIMKFQVCMNYKKISYRLPINNKFSICHRPKIVVVSCISLIKHSRLSKNFKNKLCIFLTFCKQWLVLFLFTVRILRFTENICLKFKNARPLPPRRVHPTNLKRNEKCVNLTSRHNYYYY